MDTSTYIKAERHGNFDEIDAHVACRKVAGLLEHNEEEFQQRGDLDTHARYREMVQSGKTIDNHLGLDLPCTSSKVPWKSGKLSVNQCTRKLRSIRTSAFAAPMSQPSSMLY